MFEIYSALKLYTFAVKIIHYFSTFVKNIAFELLSQYIYIVPNKLLPIILLCKFFQMIKYHSMVGNMRPLTII